MGFHILSGLTDLSDDSGRRVVEVRCHDSWLRRVICRS